MKKGIGEFGDLQRPTAMNPNPDFLKAYNENPNVFKRKDGIFSHLYDAAHRFGEDKPFKAWRLTCSILILILRFKFYLN